MVVTLLKSEDKERSDPSSYRPICLLPIMGKVLEGIILLKLKKCCEGKISDRQFGFMPGRSTEDALHKFLEIQEGMKDKYILGIFLDISNAFNNLWWPAIMEASKRMMCTRPLVRILREYLKRRSVIFRTEGGSIERRVNKGCPQGSLLGPMLWNVVFQDLIEIYRSKGIEIVVFADDVVILISGNSRRLLEARGQEAMLIAENWCLQNKMELSVKKTEMMLCEGKLNANRPPLIKLSGRQVPLVEEFKYLGITFEYGVQGLKAG